VSRPNVIAFEDPSIGLAPLLVAEISRITKSLRDDGITILLIEQNAWQNLEITHHAYVLESGHIVLQGSSQELLETDLV
jgi:branched-chain amino acid transport system ATP-binding protein